VVISFPRVLSLWCCVSFFSHDFFLLVARPCVGLPPPRGLGLLITKMPLPVLPVLNPSYWLFGGGGFPDDTGAPSYGSTDGPNNLSSRLFILWA